MNTNANPIKRPNIPPARPKLQPIATLLIDLLRAYVIDKDAVRLAVTDMGEMAIFRLTVATDDYGKAVGSQGRNIAALATIMRHAGLRTGLLTRLHLAEPPDRSQAVHCAQPAGPDWHEAACVSLLDRAAHACIPEPLACRSARDGLTVGLIVQHGSESAEHQQGAELQRAFQTVFHAIGKCEGVQMSVDFIPMP
jgi:predicted RNA-binding protein YlqC (UPF0109 family)